MGDKDSNQRKLSEMLKELRLKRAKSVRRARELLKEQRKAMSAIEAVLKKGPATVPEIARLSGLSSDRVLWWIASLKKYGFVAEGEKNGQFFAYRLVKTFGQDEG